MRTTILTGKIGPAFRVDRTKTGRAELSALGTGVILSLHYGTHSRESALDVLFAHTLPEAAEHEPLGFLLGHTTTTKETR